MSRYLNRTSAGVSLAKKLKAMAFDKKDTIVIAIPRGGVPVAYEIAKALSLPMDLLLLKTLGAPHYPELAVAFVGEDGEIFYHQTLMQNLKIKPEDLDHEKDLALIKLQEVARALRGHKKEIDVNGKNIILVDDGIQSGTTMKEAVEILKKKAVKEITLVSPIASSDTLLSLSKEVERIVVLSTAESIYSISEWYEDFTRVQTEQVSEFMNSL